MLYYSFLHEGGDSILIASNKMSLASPPHETVIFFTEVDVAYTSFSRGCLLHPHATIVYCILLKVEVTSPSLPSTIQAHAILYYILSYEGWSGRPISLKILNKWIWHARLTKL